MKLFKLNLRLFDGEGGAAASTGTEGASGEQGEQIKYESTRHTQKGENIKYGVQEVQEEVPNTQEVSDIKVTSNTLEDRKKAFRDLIEGEYKDLYTEDTQRIINRRFKETETLRSQVNDYQPIIDMLSDKYGQTDIKALMKSIEDDDNYWTEAADEAGMTVEQYKQFQKLKRENEQFQKAQHQEKVNQKVNEQVQDWIKQSEALKGKFNNFDLNNELQNPAFVSMLKAGTPVEHAYKVMHFDEMMSQNAMVTEKNVVNNIRARGARPNENGTSSQSAFIVKDDVSKLSKADRAEIARRVARGEKISF